MSPGASLQRDLVRYIPQGMVGIILEVHPTSFDALPVHSPVEYRDLLRTLGRSDIDTEMILMKKFSVGTHAEDIMIEFLEEEAESFVQIRRPQRAKVDTRMKVHIGVSPGSQHVRLAESPFEWHRRVAYAWGNASGGDGLAISEPSRTEIPRIILDDASV